MIPENKRVYLDEAGIDNNDEYAYAWGLRGKRVYGLKRARRSCRLNIISALDEKQIKAPFVFEGNCTTEVFLSYAEQILVKTLVPGKTVIMDNASFHKSAKLKQIIEEANCHLLYLPPYSPDLNPIEHHWFGIKNAIRKLIPKYDGDLYACATEVLA